MSDRRRTYLNYLFENMTYLNELINYTTNGVELISGRDYKYKNLLNGHNLSSYNKLMLIFQSYDYSYWEARNIKIIVLNRNESTIISNSSNELIKVIGPAYYDYVEIEFKDNELYVRLSNASGTLSNQSLRISDMIAIGINE